MRDNCGTLKNHWYVACTSQQLSNKPLHREIFEIPLAVYRDSEGLPHCLFDRCLHRNAMLSDGHVANKNLVCPYMGGPTTPMDIAFTFPARDRIKIAPYAKLWSVFQPWKKMGLSGCGWEIPSTSMKHHLMFHFGRNMAGKATTW